MSTVPMYTLTNENLEEDLKKALIITVEGLVKENLIDEKIGKEWVENHCILLRKKSFFKKLLDKEKDERYFTLVKKIIPEFNEEIKQ